MFDFSIGVFKLASDAVQMAKRDGKRMVREAAPSIRVYVTEKTAGGYQGLTADGRRVSDMVTYLETNWTGQWATAERTEDGYVITGGAAASGDPPEPIVDGDGG